ncbi:MAG: bifunctional oligoribonuclease/PAP phosphatase NrnA, partial [Anaerolineae bacterium]|nr:bifunctional oligoribonuclease/PAP phosphatase NrnA [Anaerolineae bacterium]
VVVERKEGVADVGFRSAGRVDVAAMALQLGGGGHPKAAGCTINAPLAEAVEIALAATRAAVAEAIQ